MDWIVAEGKNRDSAIEAGLEKLGITTNEAETKDIGEIKKLFGLGETVFRIRIRKREISETPRPEPAYNSTPSSAPRSTPVKDIYAGYRSGTDERPRKDDQPRSDGRPRREERFRSDDQPRREKRPEQREEKRHTDPPTPEELELVRNSEAILMDILEEMHIPGEVEGSIRSGRIELKISSENGGLLIGKQGSTLEALQLIMGIIVNKQSDKRYRVILDTENYRDRKKGKLEDLARKLADKAVDTGRPVPISPMMSSERKMIHSYLQHDADVDTRSEGEGMSRRVVIYPKRDRNR